MIKCKHIIWDWNGTLLDDVWLSVQSINKILIKYKLPKISESRYLEIFTFPVINYYELLGFDFNKYSFEEVGTEFIKEYTEKQFTPGLHSGTIDLLSSLKDLNIDQSLISAATQRMLDQLIEYHRINDFFVDIIGQDNHYAYGKEETVRKWIDEKQLEPSNILFIGDTIHDHEIAVKLGMKSILVSHGHTDYKRLNQSGTVILDSMNSLENWIKNNIYV